MTDLNALRTLVAESNPIPGADHVDDAEFAEVLFAIEQQRDTAGLVRPRIRWSKAVIAFAATAAAILLLIGIPLLLSTNRESDVTEPSITVAVSTTVVPPTTIAAPTTTIGRVTATTVPGAIVAPAPDITWRRFEIGDGFLREERSELVEIVGPITVIGSDLLIVGRVTDAGGGDGEPRNAVWRSSDGGENWTEIDVGDLAEEAFDSWFASAVEPDGTFLIAGENNDDALVWVSADFEYWEKSGSAELGGPNLQGIYDIVHFDSRFVAVGEDGMDAAVWTSPDGLEWSQVIDDDFSAELIGEAAIYGIARGGPGLVAVGSAGASGGFGATDAGQSDNGAIWVSSDGLEWSLLPFVDDPSRFGLASVSSDPATERLVAFGGDRWVSDDAYEWAWYDRTVPLGGPPPGASAAWIGDVAVAAGWDAALSLWISGDTGITWHRVDPDHPEFEGCTQVFDVVSFGDRFIAVGPTADSCWAEEWTATAWIGTVND